MFKVCFVFGAISLLFVLLPFLACLFVLLTFSFFSVWLFGLFWLWLSFFFLWVLILLFGLLFLSLCGLLGLSRFFRTFLLFLILICLFLLFLLFFWLWRFCLLYLFRFLGLFSRWFLRMTSWFRSWLVLLYWLDCSFFLLSGFRYLKDLLFWGFGFRLILTCLTWKDCLSWFCCLIFIISLFTLFLWCFQLLMCLKELDSLLCSLTGQLILSEDLFGKLLYKFSLISKEYNKGPWEKEEKCKLFESTKRAPTHYDQIKNVAIKIRE